MDESEACSNSYKQGEIFSYIIVWQNVYKGQVIKHFSAKDFPEVKGKFSEKYSLMDKEIFPTLK